MSEENGIKVVAAGEAVRIAMPVVEPTFWFGAPTRSGRIMAWVFGGFAVLMIASGWWMVFAMFLKLRRFLPVNNAADLLAFLVTGSGALIFAGMVLLATGAIGSAFFPERVAIEVNREEVIERWGCGPLRRQRRVRIDKIKAIGVRAPQTTSEATLRKPLEQRRAHVCLTGDGDWTWSVRCSYPHPIATELAQEIYRALAEVGSGGVALLHGDGAKSVAMDDFLDPRHVNADVENRPKGVNVVLEEKGEGPQIVCGRSEFSVSGLFKIAIFRAGLWAVLLGVGFVLIAPHLPDPLGVMRKSSWMFLLLAGGQGGLLMMVTLYGILLWASYEVDAQQVTRTGHWTFIRWRRRWKRADIAAVRVGERSGDKNRHRDVVEFVMKNGKRVVLASGGVIYLRYLATLLRRELGVGSEADVPAFDPTDPRWHLVDELEKPAQLKFEIIEAEGRVAVSRKWKGFGRLEWSAIVFGLAAGIGAAVLVPLFALPQAKGADEVEAIWMTTGFAVLLALFIFGVALYDIVDRWVLVAGAEEISFMRQTLFGRRSGHWHREELQAVRTEAQFPANPSTEVRVILVTTGGKEKLVRGKANAYRYLATVLRRVTGLPASVESLSGGQAGYSTGASEAATAAENGEGSHCDGVR
ncbi:MAG: hypothetical protein ACTHN5_05120 [Phycisphaerae bacterium]